LDGYQVREKWLKDRRGRKLPFEDLEHYCKVVTALITPSTVSLEDNGGDITAKRGEFAA